MKIRSDFVTNSSSSSYIICFARIKDEQKAQQIINQHGLHVYSNKEVEEEKNWCGELGAGWCGAVIWGVDEILKNNPNSKFVIIDESIEADYDEDFHPVYDYDFQCSDAVNDITEENGFCDIDIAMGEGRDG